jgi:hypothetical protein
MGPVEPVSVFAAAPDSEPEFELALDSEFDELSLVDSPDFDAGLLAGLGFRESVA